VGRNQIVDLRALLRDVVPELYSLHVTSDLRAVDAHADLNSLTISTRHVLPMNELLRAIVYGGPCFAAPAEAEPDAEDVAAALPLATALLLAVEPAPPPPPQAVSSAPIAAAASSRIGDRVRSGEPEVLRPSMRVSRKVQQVSG